MLHENLSFCLRNERPLRDLFLEETMLQILVIFFIYLKTKEGTYMYVHAQVHTITTQY